MFGEKKCHLIICSSIKSGNIIRRGDTRCAERDTRIAKAGHINRVYGDRRAPLKRNSLRTRTVRESKSGIRRDILNRGIYIYEIFTSRHKKNHSFLWDTAGSATKKVSLVNGEGSIPRGDTIERRDKTIFRRFPEKNDPRESLHSSRLNARSYNGYPSRNFGPFN